MHRKLQVTTGIDKVAGVAYSGQQQEQASREQSHSQLSEVDELLLRSELLLQRSQHDLQDSSGSNLNQNSSRFRLNNDSSSRGNGSGLQYMNYHDAIEVHEQVDMEEEEPYGLEPLQDQGVAVVQVLSDDPTRPQKAELTTLEQELYSISQGDEEDEIGTASQPFTPSSQRQSNLCKDLEHVQTSLYKQRIMEEDFKDQFVEQQVNDSEFAGQNELLQEPELIQNNLELMNGTQDLRPRRDFALSGSATRTQKFQDSTQTQKLTTSKLNNSQSNAKRHISDQSNSLSRTKGRKNQSIRRMSHKKGCAALVSIEATANHIRPNQQQQKNSKIRVRSLDKKSPRRSRDDRINQRSDSKFASRSKSRGSGAGHRASFASRGSRHSQSMKSGQSRSNSNQMRRSRKYRVTKMKSNVADAACSPIRFDSNISYQPQANQQKKAGRFASMSITSSAAADIAFVAHTSYHSTIKDPYQQQPQQQQLNPQSYQIQSNEVSVEVVPQGNQILGSAQQQHLRNPNLNIFHSFQQSASTIKPNSSQPQIQQRSSVQQESSSNRPGNTHTYEALTISDNKRSTRDGAGLSSERHTTNPIRQLDNEAVQCRQALRKAQDAVSPKSKLKLNLDLLKKRQEQQQIRETVGSTKALINVRSLTGHTSQQNQEKKGLARNGSSQMDQYLLREGMPQSSTCPDLAHKKKGSSKEIQPKCVICHMSAVTVHPGVYKAQKRVNMRRFNQSQNQLMQHLRNPVSVAKQLRKHLQLQATVKSQFEQFVGQAGQLAIKSLSKAPSAQCLLQQPLRRQPSRALVASSSRVNKRARSTRSGAAGGKKRDIVRLRYAPHLVASSNTKTCTDARQAINIIVNEQRMQSGSIGRRTSSHSKSRRSSKGKRAVRLHRMLSSDAKSVYGYTNSAQKARNEQCIDESAEKLVESTVCSRSMPQRYNRRPRDGFGQPRAGYLYSEQSSEPASSSFGRGDLYRSQSSNQDYQTGNFKSLQGADRDNRHQQAQSQFIQHNNLNLAKQQIQQQKINSSQSKDSEKVDRQERQWVRLSEILEDKQRHIEVSRTECYQTADKNTVVPRFETFNQVRQFNPAVVHESAQQREMMDPIQSYDRNQSRSAQSNSQKNRSRSGSSARQKKKKQSRSRSSSRQQRSQQITPRPGGVPSKDISRSASCLSNLSSRRQLASHLVSSPQANVRDSYEDLSERRNDKMANMIAQDKSGSLRHRLKRTKELVDTIEHDERQINNGQSPLQASCLNQPQFSEPEPHHIFSHIEMQSASKIDELDDITSEAMEPCFGVPNEAHEVIVQRMSNETQGDEHQAMDMHRMQPLRSKSPDRVVMSHYPPQPLRRPHQQPHYHDDHRMEQAERTFGYHRSHTQDQLLSRHQFMREVSGVKYDYRPLPPRDYNNDKTRYDKMYGQYGGPSPDLRYQYDLRGVAPPPRSYARSQTRSQLSGDKLIVGETVLSPDSVQEREYKRLIQLRRTEAALPYSRDGSHFRVKKRSSNNSGPRHNQQRQAPFNTGVFRSNGHDFDDTYQAMSTKNGTITKCDSKGYRSTHSKDSKHTSLRRVYDPQKQKRAVIPRIKTFNDMAMHRKLRADHIRRLTNFKSVASSDLDEQDDLETTQKRLDRISLCEKSRDRLRRPSNDCKSCSGHRCSVSKRNRSRSFDTGNKVRIMKSKSRSRSRSNNQIMTVTDLKDQIRRLGRPTFSSKMHEYRRKRPDPNEIGHFKRDRDEREKVEEINGDEQKMFHCDRDDRYWQQQVEGLAKSFSNQQYQAPRRDLKSSRGPQQSELVPLKKLKELSKVMNQIMDIDQHVQQLKSNLVETSEQLVRHLKHRQSSKTHQTKRRRQQYYDDDEDSY